MRRIIYMLISLICSAATAQGQTSASQVLANAIKTINAAPSIEAKFRAKASDGSNVEGTLCMRRDRFSIVTKSFATWYDGSSMWSYSESAGETTLSIPTDDELLEANPFFIIDQYSTYYKPRISQHANGAYIIHLEPTSKNAPLKSADVTIKEANWLPSAVKATFANGQAMHIDITSINVLKSPLPITEFTYPASKYPGVEVIDLR